MGYPVYILDDDTILFTNQDLDHTEFWEQEVAPKIADKFSIPVARLKNLPYCQKRGRVVGDFFYCGEKISDELMKKIRETLQEDDLRLVYDDHEKRLKYDYLNYKSLIKNGKNTTTKV